MLIPPTSLTISQEALDRIGDDPTLIAFYLESAMWQRDYVVVNDDGTIAHGESFVAAALIAGWQEIRVTHISEYRPMTNPCAEIALPGGGVCNLVSGIHPSADNIAPPPGFRIPHPPTTTLRPRSGDRRGRR